MEEKALKTFDINRVKVTDLDGQVIAVKLGKVLGNYIYASTASLDWLSAAQAIHRSDPVDISDTDLVYLRDSINSNHCQLSLICKVALQNYIHELLTIKSE